MINLKSFAKCSNSPSNTNFSKELSEKTGYSEGHLQKVFKKITGISPQKYAAALREDKLRDELQCNSSITSKIYNAGYGSSSRVYENVNRILAMSPSQFQNSGKGIQMRIGVFSCFIGVVLIALTDHGVSAVDLGDNEKVLVLSFRQRFKNAQISELKTDDKDAVTSVLKKIENPGMSLDIPMDIHGTVFQKKVWSALTNIPSGETKTYSEIASEIGQSGCLVYGPYWQLPKGKYRVTFTLRAGKTGNDKAGTLKITKFNDFTEEISVIGAKEIIGDTPGDWQRYSMDFEVKRFSETNFYEFLVNSNGQGELLVRDIELEKLS